MISALYWWGRVHSKKTPVFSARRFHLEQIVLPITATTIPIVAELRIQQVTYPSNTNIFTSTYTALPSNGFSSSTCTKFDSESAGFGRTYYKTIGSLSSARPSTGFSVSALWFLLFLIIG